MQTHGLTLVATAPEHHGRPEVANTHQVRLPVVNPCGKNRTDEWIGTNPVVKRANQLRDETFIDRNNFRGLARLLLGHDVHAPSGKAVMRW